ncbi:MAG: hypothetical protein WC367_03425 [Methanoregula sp.]|jgi:hypothetical protein
MPKQKRRRIIDRIHSADIHITVPEKTDEINPLKFPVPGFSIEKTEVGVAKIGKRNALYLRLRMRGGDQV